MTPARLQGRASVVDYRWLMLVAGTVVAACALAMLRRGHTAVPGPGVPDTAAAAAGEEQQRPPVTPAHATR